MNKVFRPLILVTTLAMAGSLAFGAAQISVADTTRGLSQVGQGAFNDLARCVRSQDSTDLNIFFLVDSSASLRVDNNNGPGSDPTNMRAVILSQTIRQLGVLNSKISVNFALDTFDTSSPGIGKDGKPNKGIPWTHAGQSEVDNAADWVKQNVPKYEYGQQTNWLAGMNNAENQLANAPHGSGTACKAIIWFTDGALDIGTNARNSQALAQLCGTAPTSTGTGIQKGVIPNLRANNITLIGVLLTSSQLTNTSAGLVSYFHPVLEGSGLVDASSFGGAKSENFECGQNPVPANYSRGAMLVAKNPDDLAFLFASIPFMVSVGQEIPLKKSNEFTVDNGVASAAIVIPSKDWQLMGPGVAINSKTSDSAFQIRTEGNISTVQFAIPKGGQGDYKVIYAGSTPISVFLDAGIKIKLDKGLKIAAGQSSQQISGTFVDYNNKPVNMGIYDKVAMSVVSIDTSGKNRPANSNQLQINGDSTWSGQVMPFDGASSAQIQFTVQLRTKPSETDLPEISQTFNLPLIFPRQFCNVKQSGNNQSSGTVLSNLTYKKTPATGAIVIEGARQGNCSIRFSAPQVLTDPMSRPPKDFTLKVAGPSGIQNSLLGRWVSVPQGAEETFVVSVNSAVKASGETSMSIPVDIQDQAQTQTIQASVKISFKDVIPEKGKVLWLILLLLIGLGLPLALLQLINFLFAPFRLADIRNTSMHVRVSVDSMGSTVTLLDGTRLVLEDRMFEYLPASLSRPKKFVAEYKNRPLANFDSHLPRNPFGKVEGVVHALPGEVIVASESSRSWANGTQAPVSLNLNRLFFATAEIKTAKAPRVSSEESGAPSIPANDSDWDSDIPAITQSATEVASSDSNSSDSNSFDAQLTIYLNINPANVNKLFASVLADISSSQIWAELARLREGAAQVTGKAKPQEVDKSKPKKAKTVRAKKSDTRDGASGTNPSGSMDTRDSNASLLNDPDDPWA